MTRIRTMAVIVCVLCTARNTAADDTPPASPPAQARWVLQATEATKGDWVGVWLVSTSPVSNTAALIRPNNAEVRVVQSPDCTASTGTSGTGALQVMLAPAGAAYFCLKPLRSGQLRVVAAVTGTGAAAGHTDVAISDPITVRTWYELGPSMAAAGGALGGFALGLLSMFISQKLQERTEGIKTRMAVERALATSLGPELLRNRESLTMFLSGKQPAQPLEAGAYNAMDAPMEAMLGKRDRRRFLEAIDALYQGPIAKFNRAVNVNDQVTAQLQASQALDAMASLGKR